MRKLSFTTMATPGLGAAESIKAARRYGYTGVDLRVSDYMGEVSLDSTAKEIAAIKSVFSVEGIHLSGLLCYNEQGGKQYGSWIKMKESVKRNMDMALRLGSPSIRIFGGNPAVLSIREDFIKRTAEVISELLRSEKGDICINVQNHQNSFTAAEVVKLAAMVDSPWFGMIFSPEHSIIQGENIENIIPELRNSVKQLYMADVTRMGNEYRSILPGKGIIPLADMYEAAGGRSFGGWVTFKWEKIWDKSLEEPDVALPYFIRFFNSMQ